MHAGPISTQRTLRLLGIVPHAVHHAIVADEIYTTRLDDRNRAICLVKRLVAYGAFLSYLRVNSHTRFSVVCCKYHWSLFESR